jgi:hypothetical protein
MQFPRVTQVHGHLHNCQFSDTNHSWLFVAKALSNTHNAFVNVMSLVHNVYRYLPGLRLNSLISFTAILRWCNVPVPLTHVQVSCTNTGHLLILVTTVLVTQWWGNTGSGCILCTTRIYILLSLSLLPLFYRAMSESLPQIAQPVWWERYTLLASLYTIENSITCGIVNWQVAYTH